MTIPRFIHKNILYLHIKTFLQRFDAYQHLYQVDLVIADIFSGKGPNHGQTLKEIPLYSRQFYSGHLL